MKTNYASPRRYPRVQVDLAEESGEQRLRDISLGGMRVEAREVIPLEGMNAFALPVDAGTLTLRGRVVWARRTGREDFPYEYGVEFNSMGPTVTEKLQGFMMLRGEAEEPPVEIAVAELERLGKRIVQLEQELTASRDAGNGGSVGATLGFDGLTPASGTAALDEWPAEAEPTGFEAKRFARLVRLGQPLLPLVADPTAQAPDDLHRSVAAVFSESFDLASLEARLEGVVSQGIIMRALHSFYQRGIIDFA